jgi:hypothetical protein
MAIETHLTRYKVQFITQYTASGLYFWQVFAITAIATIHFLTLRFIVKNGKIGL